jgi:hypothetical protein
METTMLYKTIVLELLQQRTQMYDQLRKERNLSATMERYALELKTSHEEWKETLSQAKPDSDPSQIASEALEKAIQELEGRLPSESSSEQETPSLDQAMAVIRRYSPRA